MKHSTAFLCLLALTLVTSAVAQAPAATELKQPTYSDIYCAGFITDKPVETGLYVVTGDEGGLKEMYSRGDTIFLSHGAGFIVNPGGQYMMLRPVKDDLKVEYFKGQHQLLKTLGTMYAEVGRIQLNIVHDQSATGEVLQSCGEIRAGDVAIPFNQKPAARFEKNSFDRFAPPTGKSEGLIVTGKDFANTHAVGSTVYVNIGAGQGVEVGQNYRIYRSYANASVGKYNTNTPSMVGSERMNYPLNAQQMKSVPRDVIGELVIMHVEGKSATAYITKAGAEIFSGDQIEAK